MAANPANPQAQVPEEEQSPLERFGRDLTEIAEQGKLDPVIGRDEEIRRVIQVLSRRTKNNPVLIGEPGVGKTAIVEGLAQRIVSGDVPESLRDRRVIALDMGALIAGAEVPRRVRGTAEGACSKRSPTREGAIILFIDELHTIVGAGAAEGSVDAANLLKPMLARGELRGVGATTLDEYRKHIEKDAALERRFQPVNVGEPTRRRTRSRSCAGSRSATRSTTACASRTARWSPPRRSHTATSPTASCPTRRSTSSTRPPRGIRIEIDSLPDRDRRGRPPHDAAGDRARARCQGEGRRRRGAPQGDRAPSCAELRERSRARMTRPVAEPRSRPSTASAELKERLDARARRDASAPSARPTCSAPPSCATARSPSSSAARRVRIRRARARRPGARVPQRGGRRRRHRRGRRRAGPASPSAA